MKNIIPSYERQNQWLRDYVYPIICDFDIGKVVANYQKNRKEPASVKPAVLQNLCVFPGNCSSINEFIEYISGLTLNMLKLPLEHKEALIEQKIREWLPKGSSQHTKQYPLEYAFALHQLLGVYADTVPRKKRLPQFQSIIERKHIGMEYAGNYVNERNTMGDSK